MATSEWFFASKETGSTRNEGQCASRHKQSQSASLSTSQAGSSRREECTGLEPSTRLYPSTPPGFPPLWCGSVRAFAGIGSLGLYIAV